MPTYLITTRIDTDTRRERLVEAKNVARAIAHVVRDSITCEVAGAADCVRLGKAGTEVEKAGE